MKDFKSIYQEEYEKLNKQQQAVDSVEGSVMVIAGPGTGKTQILSRRVANILTNYHTNPEEISGVVSVNELREYGQQLLKNLL
jgi:DNA-dependent ATPase I and helicase II